METKNVAIKMEKINKTKCFNEKYKPKTDRQTDRQTIRQFSSDMVNNSKRFPFFYFLSKKRNNRKLYYG